MKKSTPLTGKKKIDFYSEFRARGIIREGHLRRTTPREYHFNKLFNPAKLFEDVTLLKVIFSTLAAKIQKKIPEIDEILVNPRNYKLFGIILLEKFARLGLSEDALLCISEESVGVLMGDPQRQPQGRQLVFQDEISTGYELLPFFDLTKKTSSIKAIATLLLDVDCPPEIKHPALEFRTKKKTAYFNGVEIFYLCKFQGIKKVIIGVEPCRQCRVGTRFEKILIYDDL